MAPPIRRQSAFNRLKGESDGIKPGRVRRGTSTQARTVCFMFKKNACKFGDKCRYLHPLGEDKPLSKPSSAPAVSSTPSNPSVWARAKTTSLSTRDLKSREKQTSRQTDQRKSSSSSASRSSSSSKRKASPNKQPASTSVQRTEDEKLEDEVDVDPDLSWQSLAKAVPSLPQQSRPQNYLEQNSPQSALNRLQLSTRLGGMVPSVVDKVSKEARLTTTTNSKITNDSDHPPTSITKFEGHAIFLSISKYLLSR